MPEENVIVATCFICGTEGKHILTAEETENLILYYTLGRNAGRIQDLFPNVPAWIRSGAIDKYSNGFCICPECCS